MQKRLLSHIGSQAMAFVWTDCNNRCRFCDRSIRKLTPPSESELREFVERAAEAGATTLELSGGEPTLAPSFLPIIAHARGRFREISTLSNGRRFADPEFTRSAIEGGLTRIGVSIQGACPEVNDPLSGVAGAFEEVAAGIRNLGQYASSNPKVFLWASTVLLPQNLDDLVGLAHLLREAGVHLWRVKAPHGWRSRVRFSRAVPRLEEAARELGTSVEFVVRDIPMCVLGALAPHSADLYEERSPIPRHSGQGVEQISVVRKSNVRLDACSSCAAQVFCCRISSTYKRFFGQRELRPLSPRQLLELLAGADALAGKGAPERMVAPLSPEGREKRRAIVDAAERGDWAAAREAAERVLAEEPADEIALGVIAMYHAQTVGRGKRSWSWRRT